MPASPFHIAHLRFGACRNGGGRRRAIGACDELGGRWRPVDLNVVAKDGRRRQ
jgi:hypothetical protein